MDREHEELQFLGFFGILKQSFKIIFSWKKIFGQISLTLILPLSIIYLAHFQIAHLFFHNQFDIPTHSKSKTSPQWAAYWLFKLAYFTVLLILSLLSTAAVVYTIASIYTSKPISYKKIMSVVPKVWKRLLITFLWSFGIVFIYNIISAVIYVVCDILASKTTIGLAIILILLVLYLFGLLYITIIWHMASVVSVLEEIYGLKAISKGKNLIKGKKVVSFALFILLGGIYVGILIMFEIFVVFGWLLGLGIQIGIGVLCLLMLLIVMLVELVIQTVLYLVCKSFHHEYIDKPLLSEHLDIYDIQYVPLRKDVQMQPVDQV